jgi:hypothetical protein
MVPCTAIYTESKPSTARATHWCTVRPWVCLYSRELYGDATVSRPHCHTQHHSVLAVAHSPPRWQLASAHPACAESESAWPARTAAPPHPSAPAARAAPGPMHTHPKAAISAVHRYTARYTECELVGSTYLMDVAVCGTDGTSGRRGIPITAPIGDASGYGVPRTQPVDSQCIQRLVT